MSQTITTIRWKSRFLRQERIKTVNVEPGGLPVRFDVVSLFTNVHTEEPLKNICSCNE